jgi:hypothetical protein
MNETKGVEMRRTVTVAAVLGTLSGLGGVAVAAPNDPPPEPGPASPPPAWVDTAKGDHWLAYSGYCWTGPEGSEPIAACVDFIPPDMRPELPVLKLRRGEVVRFHLGFTPTKLSVQIGKRSFRLAATEAPTWRVRGKGTVVILSAEAESGSASYVARVRIKPPRRAN